MCFINVGIVFPKVYRTKLHFFCQEMSKVFYSKCHNQLLLFFCLFVCCCCCCFVFFICLGLSCTAVPFLVCCKVCYVVSACLLESRLSALYSNMRCGADGSMFTNSAKDISFFPFSNLVCLLFDLYLFQSIL